MAITNPVLHNKLHFINVYNEVATETLHDLRETISKLDSTNSACSGSSPLWSTTHRRAKNRILAIQPLLTVPGTRHIGRSQASQQST